MDDVNNPTQKVLVGISDRKELQVGFTSRMYLFALKCEKKNWIISFRLITTWEIIKKIINFWYKLKIKLMLWGEILSSSCLFDEYMPSILLHFV